MTFLTPTLLAGDRSQVDVVAHELAHSWTGNLVTNADMNHFWLNEGFTVWAERRIVEALRGAEVAAFGWAIGEHALANDLARFAADSPLTCLRTDLAGVDPDQAFSTIPYEKGARLLVLIEQTVGRGRFDAFVRRYIDHFRFSSISSEDFVAFLAREFPGVADAVELSSWLSSPGIPANAPRFRSPRLEELQALGQGWAAGTRPVRTDVAAWSTDETLVYLQNLPRPLDGAACAWLDETLALMQRGNHDVLVEWLTIAAASDYEPAFARIRELLSRVGRMKYLRPLYKALGRSERTRSLARQVFAEAAPRYHALSRQVAEAEMAAYGA